MISELIQLKVKIFLIVICMYTINTSIINALQACQLTQSDILGPYYLSGAPMSQNRLCFDSPMGERLILTGQVVDYESKCTRGIANVKLDVWQVKRKEIIRVNLLLITAFFRISRQIQTVSTQVEKILLIGFAEVFS